MPVDQMTVLVVDDDIINRITLQRMLGKAGHTVVLAIGGHEALQLLAEGLCPDIVLMDVEMPGMNGITALETLKASPDMLHLHGVPILAVTGHSLTEDRIRLEQAGFDAVLVKPVDVQGLLHAMNMALAAKP